MHCPLLALLYLTPARAQQPTLAIVGGRIIDGYGGPPIENGVILIAGERINGGGRRSDVAVPAGVKVISTEGMSVAAQVRRRHMHVHLMISGHGDYEHWDTTTYRSRFQTEIMRRPPASSCVPDGVTTARDLGAQLEGHHRREATHRAGRDSRAPAVRIRPFLQHDAVFAVRSAVPLGGENGQRPQARHFRSHTSSWS